MRARVLLGTASIVVTIVAGATRIAAEDTLYLTAIQDARKPILDLIAAENQRIDIGAWQFNDGVISDAIARRFNAGVKVRFVADARSYQDSNTKAQIDYLASRGVPIRLRTGPSGTDQIIHWKGGIFAGQKKVAFGSANWTVYSLRPYSSTNYDDETMLVTDNSEVVPAFKMQFDRMWVDTTNFTDFANITPGVRVRLEPDAVLPAFMTWTQGSENNAKLIAEIDAEQQQIDWVVYRLDSVSVTDALVRRVQAGVSVRLVIDPVQYRNSDKAPHAAGNLDRLWALYVPIRQRIHQGMTHMKTIVTSTVATNGSSNVADSWQRDHNYFIERALRPTLYEQLRNRVAAMFADTAGFSAFRPQPPGTASLVSPGNGATGVSTTPLLDWTDAAWATSYDVLLGTTENNMTVVASRAPTSQEALGPALQSSATYYWRVRARTNATPRDGSISATSPTWSFTTGGSVGNLLPAVSLTAPADGASFAAPAAVTLAAAASDSDGTIARVEFFANGGLLCTRTVAPYSCSWSDVPAGSYSLSAVATDDAGARKTSGTRTIIVSSSGTTTGSVVLYAAKATLRAGAWMPVEDGGAGGGARMYNWSNKATVTAPAASPRDYFELQFMAQAGMPYRLWMRGKADGDSYENDSTWVQFSGSLNPTGSPAWRIGSTDGIKMSIEECSGCGLSGWGWHDNGWGAGVRGETITFASSGVQTIRVQPRQDGVSIDQIVLSPGTYLSDAPGSAKNDSRILDEKDVAAGTGDVVLRPADLPPDYMQGDWNLVADASAAGGARIANPDRGAGKILTAAASPVSYFEVAFVARAGRPYHLWLRLRAQNDTYTNDSVFVQFSGTVASDGTPTNLIGTSQAAAVSLEDTNGAGVQGWGWNDNAWAALGASLYFARDGFQRLRVQLREDGVSVDQIVLSPSTYLGTAPGALKNDTTILLR